MTHNRTTLATLHHRSSPAQPGGACWEFTVTRGLHRPSPTLIARVVHAGATYDLEIPLCTSGVPRPLAWPLQLLESGWWMVGAHRYGDDSQGANEAVPFAPGLPAGSLELVDVPAGIEAEMLRIESVLREK